jgi:glycosyltransferase involved in cell wall biosynthesis
MKPKLMLLMSVPISFNTLLRGQAKFLSKTFDVTIVTSPGAGVEAIREYEGVPVVTVEMTRQITPTTDAKAVSRLAMLFAAHQPDIVQTYTAKAGLAGQLGALMARVPHRVHGIVGMKIMEEYGARRQVLTALERVTYGCTTDLTANSHGLVSWIRENRLTDRPITVIGDGSINGVDTDVYHNTWSAEEQVRLRAELGLTPENFVFLFIGRMVKDKGVGELMRAFDEVYRSHPHTRLLLVGDYEKELDPLDPEAERLVETHPGVRRTGFVNDVRPPCAIADALILPSYREGLPNSVIEAGSMGLPAIVTNINGCNEIIHHEENGLIVPMKQVEPLTQAMVRLLNEPGLHARLKAAARPSVVRRYDQKWFWGELQRYYEGLL